jgi:hypothetical protein
MIDAQAEAEVIEIDSGIVRWVHWLVFALVIFLLSALARRRFGAITQQRFAEWRAAQTPEANEKAAYGKLKSVCRSGDYKAIRDALLTWANHYCASERGGRVRSMEDLVRLSPSRELTEQANELQSMLFNAQSSSDFDSAKLVALVALLRKSKRSASKQMRREEKYQLPSLYKS